MKKSVLIIIIVAAILLVLFFAVVLKKRKEAQEAAANGSDDNTKTIYTNTGGGGTPAPTPAPTVARDDSWPLKKGSKGERVKLLQVYLGGLTPDGDFGAKTEAAVKVAFGKSTVEKNDLQPNVLRFNAVANREKSVNPQGNFFPLMNGTVGFFVKMFQLGAGIAITGKYGNAEIAAAKKYFNTDTISAAQIQYLIGNKFFDSGLSKPTVDKSPSVIDYVLSGLKFGL